MSPVNPLSVDQLYQFCDPSQFHFETTNDLADIQQVIGQPRAVEAVRFGMGIEQEGYNIFALGEAGTGKQSLITQFFEQKARTEPVPPDWCYVHNFEQDFKPNAISLPPGMGVEFQRDMQQLVEELRSTLVAGFESEEYRSRRRAIEEEVQEKQEKALEEIRQRAQQNKLALLRTPGGIIFAPMKEDGEVLQPDEFQKMSEEDRQRLEKMVEQLQGELQVVLQGMPAMQRELRARIQEFNREMTRVAVGNSINDLRQKYAEFPEVVAYLDAVEKDVVENSRDFLPAEETPGAEDGNPVADLMARMRKEQSPLKRYQVNVMVNNHDLRGAPVIYEDNPTYPNLVGRVDHIAQFGALTTDFTLIKAGALHRANGGYLILDARKVLLQSFSWDALKRSLLSAQVTIESIGQMLNLVSTISVEPEPIPLHVKVALLGDRFLYYLLSQNDPEFGELFKVQADFDVEMNRTPESQEQYAQLVATVVRKNNLLPFDRGATARVIEQSARVVGDSEKLSIQVKDIADLLRESSYWASQNGHSVVEVIDVQKAIDARIYRSDRVRERFQETILRRIQLISTEGTQVGQLNGLSVLQLPDFSFAIPSRITARVSLGKGDVVDIEREVDLSGPIHSKGVMILSGFLRGRYALEKPLSLSASLVFEQSYSGVEGDSASSAELYALLSAISGIPIKQSLAVTGSVNQHGEVQAIGGVNEKIEGFFDICKSRGLNGEQGVLIPASNVEHLMLRWDIRQAVQDGKFSVYPIQMIDQGIEVLTGIPAGEPDENGQYPADSVNGRVFARLAEFSKKVEQLRKGEDKDKEAQA